MKTPDSDVACRAPALELGAGLLGSPPEPGASEYNRKFGNRIQQAITVVSLIVRDNPEINSRPKLAAFITAICPNARPYSESLFRILGGIVEVDDSGCFDKAYRLLDASAEPQTQEPFPVDRIAEFMSLAGTLISEGIQTPGAMARVLDEQFDKRARKYSESFWDVFGIIDKSMRGTHSWDEIYIKIDQEFHAEKNSNLPVVAAFEELINAGATQTDNPQERHQLFDDQAESQSELGDKNSTHEADVYGDDEDIDSPEAIGLWAQGIGEQIDTFQDLLAATGMRRGINPDLVAATEKMRLDLGKMLEGELPEDSWRLELYLTHCMSGGASSGSRNYELTLDGEGVSAMCYGSEWQQGEGSDTWTGARFSYQPNGSKRESGNLYEFVGEFKTAIRDSDYVLSVEFNGDSICKLPTDSNSDSEVELQVKRLLRQLISELQDMQDTLSGDDSGLVNVWDEICAQQQIEEFCSWDAYDLTIRSLIEGTVSEMSRAEQLELWLQTETGWSWAYDNESREESPCPCDEDIGEHLYGRLMSVAADYLNHRVIGYRNRPDHGGDDASEVVDVAHKWDLTPGIELTMIEGLVARLSRLAGLSPAVAEELTQLRAVLVEMRHGVIPENMWELELSETIGDERSRGTRTFQIFADKDGVRINRDDTAWQEGVGSDSVSGPSFYITHNSEEHCANDLCALIQDFESAAAEGIDALMLRIDGSPIC